MAAKETDCGCSKTSRRMRYLVGTLIFITVYCFSAILFR